MKKVIGIVMAVLMALSLAACSKEPEVTESYWGLYEVKTATYGGLTLNVTEYFEEFSVELKAKNKCTIRVNGDSANGKYELSEDGKKISFSGGGVECSGDLGDGTMTLYNVMDSGLTLGLECADILAKISMVTDMAAKNESLPAEIAGTEAALEAAVAQAEAAVPQAPAEAAVSADGILYRLTGMGMGDTMIGSEYIGEEDRAQNYCIVYPNGTCKLVAQGEEVTLNMKDGVMSTSGLEFAKYTLEGDTMTVVIMDAVTYVMEREY